MVFFPFLILDPFQFEYSLLTLIIIISQASEDAEVEMIRKAILPDEFIVHMKHDDLGDDKIPPFMGLPEFEDIGHPALHLGR